MSSDLFFYTSSDDEDEVNSELVMFTEACQAAYEASKPKVQRTPVERDRYGAHDRLVMAYFSEHPQYDEATFRQRGISSLMKWSSAIRQMAYGAVPNSLDEYLQMGATTARDSLRIFCKHGFPGMLGSIDCTHWLWANCPVAFRAQFSWGDHEPDPFILLEAIASNDLWIWHAFFGVSGMNNDVKVLRQSPIFNDLKSGRAPDVPFVANNVLYKRGYYLTDGIYPQWSVLIKSIKNPGTHDHKRILYKTKHEATRKDVERAFGVLKQKWKLIKYPARGMSRKEQHRDDDPVRTHEESMQVTQEIVDRTAHLTATENNIGLYLQQKIACFRAQAPLDAATMDDIDRLHKCKFKKIGDFEKQSEEIQEDFSGSMIEYESDINAPMEHALPYDDAECLHSQHHAEVWRSSVLTVHLLTLLGN
ncbi:ALP1-like protein [Tanacetum coccineum]